MRPSLLIALACLPACYQYAPVEPAALTPGASVRARVSPATAEQIEPLLLVSDARVLVGTLVSSGDTLMLEVPTSARAEIDNSVQALRQRIALPRASIIEIESRRLDRTRTGLVVGAAGIVVGSLLFKAITGNPGKDRLPSDTPGSELRFPILQLPVP